MADPNATIDTLIKNAISDSSARIDKVNYWSDAAFYKPTNVVKSDMQQFPDLVLPTLAGLGAQVAPTLSFPDSVTIPNIVIPKNDAVYGDDIIDIIHSLNSFSASFAAGTIGPRLVQLFSDFFTRYYPKFVTEQYGPQQVFDILNQVAPTKAVGFTMASTAEDAIYQRGRSEILDASDKQQYGIANDWSNRGFNIPPGGMYREQLIERVEAQRNIAKVASDIAVQQEELMVSTYKFAIEQAIDFRQKALDNAVAYLRSFISAIMQRFDANAYAGILDARNRFYSTTLDMYRTANATREMTVRMKEGNRDINKDVFKALQAAYDKELEIKSTAAVGSATALGHVAAAAVSSLHASATMSTNYQG